MKHRKKRFISHKFIAVLGIVAILILIVFAVWTDKAVRPVASMQAGTFFIACDQQDY